MKVSPPSRVAVVSVPAVMKVDDIEYISFSDS
jgi:hypothetical protein